MKPQSLLHLPLLVVLGTTALAQVVTPEIEPNESKTAATPSAACMVPGDILRGNSTGSVTTPGATSLDTWDVTICTEPNRIYENRLTLTVPGGPDGHTGSLRGLTQSAGGVINLGTDATHHSSSTLTVPPRFVQWYGFGKGERLYYRVTGVAATVNDYLARFSSTPVRPSVVPGVFAPGPITVTTVGQGHATDTEIYVYDSNCNPVPTFHNDDEGPGGVTLQSRATRPLTPGTYYAAIGRYNTANNQSDANADEDFTTGVVLDFPNILATSTTLTNSNVAFSISDGGLTVPVAATAVNRFEVRWFSFVVGTGSDFKAYCSGDGLDPNVTTACPCGNFGSTGHGCANSVNAAGATLTASGAAVLDNVVLHGAGMPATVSCIYLKANANLPVGAVFHDGISCLSGTIIRLRTVANVGGMSEFPNSAETVTLSQRGQTPVGSGLIGYYSTFYRNAAAAFCPPATANNTNGWIVAW